MLTQFFTYPNDEHYNFKLNNARGKKYTKEMKKITNPLQIWSTPPRHSRITTISPSKSHKPSKQRYIDPPRMITINSSKLKWNKNKEIAGVQRKSQSLRGTTGRGYKMGNGGMKGPPWHVHPGYYSPPRVVIPRVLSISLCETESRLTRTTGIELSVREKRLYRENGVVGLQRGNKERYKLDGALWLHSRGRVAATHIKLIKVDGTQGAVYCTSPLVEELESGSVGGREQLDGCRVL